MEAGVEAKGGGEGGGEGRVAHRLIQVKRPVGGGKHDDPLARPRPQAVPVQHELVLELPDRAMLVRPVPRGEHAVHFVNEDDAGREARGEAGADDEEAWTGE